MTAIHVPELIEEVDQVEVRANIDAQARKAFGISGDEFLARLRGGDVQDLDHAVVIRLEFAADLLDD